jgi:hypothetical protein
MSGFVRDLFLIQFFLPQVDVTSCLCTGIKAMASIVSKRPTRASCWLWLPTVSLALLPLALNDFVKPSRRIAERPASLYRTGRGTGMGRQDDAIPDAAGGVSR